MWAFSMFRKTSRMDLKFYAFSLKDMSAAEFMNAEFSTDESDGGEGRNTVNNC